MNATNQPARAVVRLDFEHSALGTVASLPYATALRHLLELWIAASLDPTQEVQNYTHARVEFSVNFGGSGNATGMMWTLLDADDDAVHAERHCSLAATPAESAHRSAITRLLYWTVSSRMVGKVNNSNFDSLFDARITFRFEDPVVGMDVYENASAGVPRHSAYLVDVPRERFDAEEMSMRIRFNDKSSFNPGG